MIPEEELILIKMVKHLEKELRDRGLSEAVKDMRSIRRKIVKGIIDAEVSLRMVDLDKED